jgi:uncharacterized membrane protein YfcA
MATLAFGQTAWLAALLVMAGACAGMLAGLFGVGGGTVIVPVLYEVFGLYGVPDEIRMPLCIGTSLAVIVPTSISSFAGHYKKGAVDSAVLRVWILPIFVGVVAGTVVATFAKPVLFKAVFIAVSLFLAVRLLAGKDKWRLGEKLPGAMSLTCYGLIIGLSSSLMGIGGGLLATLVLSLYGTPIHVAIATASGVGVIVSIPGALGYLAAGWNQSGLPPLSLGYVSIIGLALLTPLSLMTVRYGVNFAHRLDKRQMEIALSAYLFFISFRFLVSMQ